MTRDGEASVLREAGQVLRRLADQVEDGTLAADDGADVLVAAAWRGASEALAQAARPVERLA